MGQSSFSQLARFEKLICLDTFSVGPLRLLSVTRESVTPEKLSTAWFIVFHEIPFFIIKRLFSREICSTQKMRSLCWRKTPQGP
jgi:hypothetical protein